MVKKKRPRKRQRSCNEEDVKSLPSPSESNPYQFAESDQRALTEFLRMLARDAAIEVQRSRAGMTNDTWGCIDRQTRAKIDQLAADRAVRLGEHWAESLAACRQATTAWLRDPES